jgi:hypothetical protein
MSQVQYYLQREPKSMSLMFLVWRYDDIFLKLQHFLNTKHIFKS